MRPSWPADIADAGNAPNAVTDPQLAVEGHAAAGPHPARQRHAAGSRRAADGRPGRASRSALPAGPGRNGRGGARPPPCGGSPGRSSVARNLRTRSAVDDVLRHLLAPDPGAQVIDVEGGHAVGSFIPSSTVRNRRRLVQPGLCSPEILSLEEPRGAHSCWQQQQQRLTAANGRISGRCLSFRASQSSFHP